jgi:hypothetical protein
VVGPSPHCTVCFPIFVIGNPADHTVYGRKVKPIWKELWLSPHCSYFLVNTLFFVYNTPLHVSTLHQSHHHTEGDLLQKKKKGCVYKYANVVSTRGRGSPKQTWRRSVHNEALEKGKSWSEVKRMTRDRTRWRRFVDTLCPIGDNRNWWRWWWCVD